MDRFRAESFLPLTPVAFEVLLALADQSRHGYSILQEVEARSGGAVTLHAGHALPRAGPAARTGADRGAGCPGRSRPRGRAATVLRHHGARRRGRTGRDRPAREPAGVRAIAAVAAGGRGMSAGRWLAERLFGLALLAYPRAFRRRFGDEMRDDFRRRGDTGAHLAATVGALIKDGLTERGAAIARWSFWPNHQPHLYEPSGRHAMIWDSIRVRRPLHHSPGRAGARSTPSSRSARSPSASAPTAPSSPSSRACC